MNEYILEPKKKIPVIAKVDLCVVGGSCTGVFAAVRAARLGLKVLLIEQQNKLGGTAVSGLVNIWHSIYDTDWKKQIIAGLTSETLERLKKRDAVICTDDCTRAFIMNPWELSITLDELIKENKIDIMLHTTYAGVMEDNGELHTIFVESKDGRGAIQSSFFIDATGDGLIARDLDIPSYTCNKLQPPSSCFQLQGDVEDLDVDCLLREHGTEFGLTDDWGWSTVVAGCSGISMRADNHVFNVQCNKARDLTYAEMEGRRQAAAFLSMINKYGKKQERYALTALCSYIGIRETVHYETMYKATAEALLMGERYDAPVLNGSYRIDIHHSDDAGITFQYLDGTEEIIYGRNEKRVLKNWREEKGISGEAAKYYQVPFELLVGRKYKNFIAVGRMINADQGAFGALRVMVNLNQLGEAAGVAAYLCVNLGKSLNEIHGPEVTKTLRNGGSAL